MKPGKKYDCRDSRPLIKGEKIVVFYEDMPHECYQLYDAESYEETKSFLMRHEGNLDRLAPVRVCD